MAKAIRVLLSLGANELKGMIVKIIAIRIAIAMIVPVAAAAGATLVAYQPEAFQAFCEQN